MELFIIERKYQLQQFKDAVIYLKNCLSELL